MSGPDTFDGDRQIIESLRRERDRFVALAFCAADVLFELNPRHEIIFAAGATSALTGRAPEKLVGGDFFALIAETDREVVRSLVQDMRRGGRLEPIHVEIAGPGEVHSPVTMTGYHLPELADTIFLAVRMTAKKSEPAAQDGFKRDADSGLLTKEDFATSASERIRQARDDGEELHFTVVRMPEIEELRHALDAEAGRNLIKAVGACLRAASTAGEMAARLDEQNYGLVHAADADIGGMAGRIERVTRSADPEGRGVTVSTGTVDAELAIANGDDAAQALLFTINKFCEMQPDGAGIAGLSANLEQLVTQAASQMTTFREIVSADSFGIAFQPIVHIATEHIHHFEALARFSAGSEHSPYELITFAEDTGLICEFDFAMCRKLISWLEQVNRYGHRYIVALNLSGRSVTNYAFLTALHDLLRRHEEIRQQLMIEITESAQIRDLRTANKFIQSLRQAGHKVCLDDFGAGAAALKYLHALDVDVVKIDGQYIRGAVDGRKHRAFLRSIVGLCKELEIHTIAEMVEDYETVAVLKDIGVEFGQGYLYGRPQKDITAFDAPRPGAVSG